MTADQLIQNARDTAQRLYPEDAAQRAQYEAEMLRRYLREVISAERDRCNDLARQALDAATDAEWAKAAMFLEQLERP